MALPALNITVPSCERKVGRRVIGTELLPLTPVLSFLKECALIDEGARGTKNKLTRLKNYLIAQHIAIFGYSPSENTPLNVIRARCSYRLQYEAMRIAGKEMGSKFLQNYNAVMKFDDADPFGGCEETTQWIARRLLIEEGRTVSMTAIKKLDAGATKKGSPGSPADAGAAKELIFGKFRATEVVRWFATIGARCNQVEKVLNSLGITLAVPTIRGNLGKGARNDGVPNLTEQEAQKLRDLLPQDMLKPRKKRSPGNANPEPPQVKNETPLPIQIPEPVKIKKLIRIK